jgi:tetratricopeptide (TPR) repeat protein
VGFVRARQKRHEEAARWFDRALAASPDDSGFQRFAAANLLLEAYESLPEDELAQVETTGTPPGVLRARELLARSLASDEDNDFSMTLYGQTFLYEPPEKTGPGIAALEKARRLSPRNVEAVLGLAQLRAQRGEVDAARDLVENHLARIADPEELRLGREMVITAAYEDARASAVAGDLEGALGKMKALREAVPDPALAALLEESIGQLEAGIRHKKDVDAYNAAVTHANAGRMDEARAIWARLAAEAADEELRKAAAEALRRIGLRSATPAPTPVEPAGRGRC